MRQTKRLYSFLLPLLFAENIVAQHPLLDFNLITGANGVTIGKITGITQDRSGYMWFVTWAMSLIIFTKTLPVQDGLV